MRITIRQIGNSRGVILPRPILSQLQFGDAAELTVEDDAIVIRRPRKKVRQGWAEAAHGLAERGETGLAWPDFPNAFDKTLKW